MAAPAPASPPDPSRPRRLAGDLATAELAALGADLAAVEAAWRALAGGLSPAQFAWRPGPGRWGAWSVGEHLAHLNLVDASYLPHLDRMIAAGRAAGRVARGARPRHPWLGRLLVRGSGPPVTVRVRTAATYVPGPGGDGATARPPLDRAAVLGAFAATRRALQERVAAAAGLDPGRMRARFAPGLGPARFVILSLGQWLALTAAHDRRHLWLAERVLKAPGFPAGPSPGAPAPEAADAEGATRGRGRPDEATG